MIQRDYLMRMIQEFIKTMALLMESKSVGDLKRIEENLDESSRSFFDLTRDQVCDLDQAGLKQALIRSGSTQEFKLRAQVLSRILTESAELAATEGRQEAMTVAYLKALNLLLETVVGSEPVELLEFTPRIEGVLDALGRVPLPPETLIVLMQYFEQQDEYGKAEDQLFQLCENCPNKGALRELGESFYRRMSGKPDSILAGGGLPRDEVESGLREFRQRCGR